MKTEFNQFIHVEGDAHIYNHVGGNRGASEGFMGIVFGALGAMGALGLLVAFVVHLLEMLTAWVAAHALGIGIAGTVAALGTGYAVYRTKRRVRIAVGTGRDLSLQQRDRCHGELLSDAEALEAPKDMPRHRLNRDIETIYFTETPAHFESLSDRRTTINRHE